MNNADKVVRAVIAVCEDRRRKQRQVQMMVLALAAQQKTKPVEGGLVIHCRGELVLEPWQDALFNLIRVRHPRTSELCRRGFLSGRVGPLPPTSGTLRHVGEPRTTG